MPALFQRRFLIPASAGAFLAPAFFVCALIRPILSAGWETEQERYIPSWM
jgi:hypothetical protein